MAQYSKRLQKSAVQASTPIRASHVRVSSEETSSFPPRTHTSAFAQSELSRATHVCVVASREHRPFRAHTADLRQSSADIARHSPLWFAHAPSSRQAASHPAGPGSHRISSSRFLSRNDIGRGGPSSIGWLGRVRCCARIALLREQPAALVTHVPMSLSVHRPRAAHSCVAKQSAAVFATHRSGWMALSRWQSPSRLQAVDFRQLLSESGMHALKPSPARKVRSPQSPNSLHSGPVLQLAFLQAEQPGSMKLERATADAAASTNRTVSKAVRCTAMAYGIGARSSRGGGVGVKWASGRTTRATSPRERKELHGRTVSGQSRDRSTLPAHRARQGRRAR